jgi:hypothetical protein
MIPRQGYGDRVRVILHPVALCRGNTPSTPAGRFYMPIHKVPRARLYEDSVAIEREGERIVQVMLDPDDSSRWLVITQWVYASGVETRGVS